MEFRFNLNEVFKQPVIEIGHTLIPSGFKGDRRALWDVLSKVTDVVNAMGAASAAAQGLTKPITTADRLRNSDQQVVYLLIDSGAYSGKGAVTGMLKTGTKGLYVFDREGHHYQVQSPCVLDFYVHESRQRSGFGKLLFEHMLQKEHVQPVKLAIDRPSDKFLGFLNKHYSLQEPIRQMNNYVVYDGFFPEVKNETGINNNGDTPSKRGSNGLQSQMATSPYGRYGAPRPPCSMGQIIHNQTSAVTPQEPSGNAQAQGDVAKPQNWTLPAAGQQESIEQHGDYEHHVVSNTISAPEQQSELGNTLQETAQPLDSENTPKQYYWPFHLPKQDYRPSIRISDRNVTSSIQDVMQPDLYATSQVPPQKVDIETYGRPVNQIPMQTYHYMGQEQIPVGMENIAQLGLHASQSNTRANYALDCGMPINAQYNHFSKPYLPPKPLQDHVTAKQNAQPITIQPSNQKTFTQHLKQHFDQQHVLQHNMIQHPNQMQQQPTVLAAPGQPYRALNPTSNLLTYHSAEEQEVKPRESSGSKPQEQQLQQQKDVPQDASYRPQSATQMVPQQTVSATYISQQPMYIPQIVQPIQGQQLMQQQIPQQLTAPQYVAHQTLQQPQIVSYQQNIQQQPQSQNIPQTQNIHPQTVQQYPQTTQHHTQYAQHPQTIQQHPQSMQQPQTIQQPQIVQQQPQTVQRPQTAQQPQTIQKLQPQTAQQHLQIVQENPRTDERHGQFIQYPQSVKHLQNIQQPMQSQRTIQQPVQQQQITPSQQVQLQQQVQQNDQNQMQQTIPVNNNVQSVGNDQNQNVYQQQTPQAVTYMNAPQQYSQQIPQLQANQMLQNIPDYHQNQMYHVPHQQYQQPTQYISQANYVEAPTNVAQPQRVQQMSPAIQTNAQPQDYSYEYAQQSQNQTPPPSQSSYRYTNQQIGAGNLQNIIPEMQKVDPALQYQTNQYVQPQNVQQIAHMEPLYAQTPRNQTQYASSTDNKQVIQQEATNATEPKTPEAQQRHSQTLHTISENEIPDASEVQREDSYRDPAAIESRNLAMQARITESEKYLRGGMHYEPLLPAPPAMRPRLSGSKKRLESNAAPQVVCPRAAASMSKPEVVRPVEHTSKEVEEKKVPKSINPLQRNMTAAFKQRIFSTHGQGVSRGQLGCGSEVQINKDRNKPNATGDMQPLTPRC